jgi:hypothetical protein
MTVLFAYRTIFFHSLDSKQGMNSSIQDSVSLPPTCVINCSDVLQFNLGWKLSLVYKGYASAALLDTYQEERLPIIAEMLGKTTEIFNKDMERSGDITVSAAGRSNTDMTQLGVNYRGSSIVGEDNIRDTTLRVSGYNKDSETAACPGDRAPEVPALINANGKHKRKTLFDIFSPSHHSVLVFTKTYEEHSALALSSVINRLPGNSVRSILIVPFESNINELGTVYNEVFRVIDSGGHACSSYSLPSDQSYFVVIRPDGVVGARVPEVAGVERYFRKIFS